MARLRAPASAPVAELPGTSPHAAPPEGVTGAPDAGAGEVRDAPGLVSRSLARESDAQSKPHKYTRDDPAHAFCARLMDFHTHEHQRSGIAFLPPALMAHPNSLSL